MEDNKQKHDDRRVNIMGYDKSRVEIFVNGIIFMFFHVLYETLIILKQLPEKWDEKDLMQTDRGIWVPLFLLMISYMFMNFAIFGGEGRMDRCQEKFGTVGIVVRKYALIMAVIFISLTTPTFIILTFF